MSDAPMRASRRTVLCAMGMVPLAVACAGPTPSSSAGLDLATAPGRLRAYQRMRGALDDRVVVGFVTGRYFGIVDAEATPLFGVAAATFSRYRNLPEGSVLLVSCEQAYYTDLDTGAVLDEWVNPLNGERVKVPVVQTDGARRTLTGSLVFTGAAIPGVAFDQIVLPPERQGDDVVFVEQVRYAATAPGRTRAFRYSEAVSARSSATDLANSAAPRVPCTTAFTNMSDWRPWMRMTDRPGVLVGHGSGRYGAALDALPRIWLDATKKQRPRLLIDPGVVLEAAWKS